MKLIILILAAMPLMAQQVTGPRVPSSGTYANRPTSPATGTVYIATDTDCGGTASATPTQCRWSGSTWQATGGVGGAGAVTCTVTAVSSIACTHNLGTGSNVPWVICNDSGGNELGGLTASTFVTDIKATSTNVVTISFSGATTGVCLISTGNQGPQGAVGATGPAGDSHRTVCIPFGSKNATAVLADADLADNDLYPIVLPSTLIEVTVRGDAGTPSVFVGRDRGGSVANLTSSSLTTASSGGVACSNVGGTTSIFGTTTCSSTLQNTSLSVGDWIVPVSGTAGGTAKQMSVCVTWTINP